MQASGGRYEELQVEETNDPRNRMEQRIAKNWKIEEGFMEIDNSKKLSRRRTRWQPPRENYIKLNFDGPMRMEGIS